MELESLKCPCCGEGSLSKTQDGLFRCAYCDSLFSQKETESYAERVEKILIAKGEADIGRLRFLLNEELHKPFFDRASIDLTCRDILALLPEDFKAAFVRAFLESKRFPGNYDAFLNKYKKIPLGAFDKRFAYPLMVDLCPYAHLHTVKEFLLAQGDLKEWAPRLEKAKKERMEENERFANIERDVFVCHSSLDFARVEPIIKYLEEDGFTCWYSQRNLPKDIDNYKIGIEQAIESCRVFLVVMSTSSIMSKDCQWEMDIARRLGKDKRVEYRIEDRRNNPKFAQFFDGFQWIDGAFCDKYEDLSFRINNLLDEPSAPEPKPAAKPEAKPSPKIAPTPMPKAEPKPAPKTEPVGEKQAEEAYKLGKKLQGEGKLEEAAKQLRAAAEAGHLKAQVALGYAYHHGNGVPKDAKEGTKWYLLAAQADFGIAQYNMGVCYRDGNGVAQDYAEAFKWFDIAARKGDVDAMNALGVAYEKGRSVPVNYAKAFSYYRQAAEGGSATGMRNLGLCYQSGMGTSKDLAEGFRWIRLSAEEGNKEAFTSLALCYDFGKGTEVNHEEAAKWYLKGAEAGDALACYNLAVSYRDGQGVELDVEKYLHWLTKAAEKGYKTAEYSLGKAYYYGNRVTQDKALGVKWILKAAEDGYVDAMTLIASIYGNGKGVPQDNQKCFYWNKKAAELGDREGKNSLGVCYELGRGTAKDYSKALHYYKEAAALHSRSAEYNLGLCYRDGKGVPVDLKEAEKWFSKAAEDGHPDAAKAIEKLHAAK